MGVTITQSMIAGAKQTESLYGVPASITLGQIMLESGGSYAGGLSGLASKYNNLFGMTAGSSWTGKTVYMTNKNGTDGQTYRVYGSQQESIMDHGKLLSTSRYTKYTSSAKTIDEYAKALKSAGYAEDPNYATKLMNIINQNNLTQYDGGGSSHGGGGVAVDENGNIINTGTGEETDLKWWGDVVVIVLCCGLVIMGVVFFVLAFGGSPTDIALNAVTKGKAKAITGSLDKITKKGE